MLSALPPSTPPLYRKQGSSEDTRKRPSSPPVSSSAGSSLSPSSSPPSRLRSMSESSANSSAFVVHSTRPQTYSSYNNSVPLSAGHANEAQREPSNQVPASRGGSTSANKKEKNETFGDKGERRAFRSGSSEDPNGHVGKRAPVESESEYESSDSSSASPTTSNVVDFLYQAGKRYKQRLQLLRQEKIAVEMANLTGKPTISPFAEEYYSNRMKLRQRLGHGGEEETVQDRLHRLHERKLEREKEKLAKYAAQKQEKELADLTLKPKITEAAKRLERRGSQADITAKWLEERKQKTMKLHEAKLYREMAEVQPIPMISPYSTQIVSSGVNSFFQSNDASIFHHSRSSSAGGGLDTDQSRREAAGGVSEYLLAREKERRQRLQAMREAREKLEASAFKPVISAKASALQMGDVVDRLYQPKRNALERYNTHLQNTSATRSTNKSRKGDGHQINDNNNDDNSPLDYSSASSASSAVRSDDDHHAGSSGVDEEEEESDYEEAVDEEGNLIIVRIVRRVQKKKSNNKRSSRRRRRGAGGGGAVSPTQEAKAALDKIFNPECTFKPYISEASRILVEQRERRLKAEAGADKTKEEDQHQSHHNHLLFNSSSPSPTSPSASHSQQRKRQQQHNSNTSNMSATFGRTNNSDPSRDPQYRKVYPDHTFKPAISETSRMLAAMRQKKADEREHVIEDSATLNKRGERGGGGGRAVGNINTVSNSSKDDDSEFDTNEVSSVRSSQGTNRSFKKASTRSKLPAKAENANGYGSDDEGDNNNNNNNKKKTEYEEAEAEAEEESSYDRRKWRQEGGLGGGKKDLSTELSVNRHLKLLPNDDDDEDDEYENEGGAYDVEVKKSTTTTTTRSAGGGGGGHHQAHTTSHGRPPQPHSTSRSNGQAIGTSRTTNTHTARGPPSASSYPHRRSASAALSSTNSNNTNTTNTNSALSSSSIEFYGKPSINANSKRIAEEKKRRLKEELKREQARLAAVLAGQKAMTEDGTTSLSSSSVAVGGGDHYYGARRGGQEGGHGPEEYTARGGVDAVTAAGYASEDVESLTAHDLLYHLSKRKREEKERRIAAELRERALAEEAKCTFTPQREFGKGNFKGDPAIAMGTRGGGGAEGEETSPTLERRRLIMTKEGADAFARRNEQWLRRRDQTLASLKSSEVDKGLEECTFHPRVHDQIPLPIGTSANAPGVDNFLQRQKAARQRKEEEDQRKSSLGGSVPNVDRRPIGGVTRPEPFLLGKDREKQQRLAYGSHQHNSTSAEGDFYSGAALNRSELHRSQQNQNSSFASFAARQTTANTNTMTPSSSAHPNRRFVDPNPSEMEPSGLYTTYGPPSNGSHRGEGGGGGVVGGHGKGMTKREWAGIREEMLASSAYAERPPTYTYAHGAGSGGNGQQQINSRYQAGVPLPPPPPSHLPPSAAVGGPSTRRNRDIADPHMAEFSQHPSALAKAVDTFAGASALMGAYRGEGAHTTASATRRGNRAPPHATAKSLHDQYLGSEKRLPTGQEEGRIGGLFEASPADFVLNNHNRIAREFHMR